MIKEKIAFFDTRNFEKSYYSSNINFEINFFDNKLNYQTVELCRGYRAVSCFVNDHLDKDCLQKMSSYGVEIIALRCAGYNNVDINEASKLGITICRVPSYSPESVAEFTLLQMLCLSRKIHRSYLRTRELNFSLEGLVGTSLSNKTIGVVGTGQIGSALIKLLSGFDAKILAFDNNPSKKLSEDPNISYVSLEELVCKSDVLSLHVPLNTKTHHLIGDSEFDKMKNTSFIVNTGRGALIDSRALINALKKGKITGAAIDVYEEEENYFFEDFSDSGIDDDVLARLVSFPNVLVTAHQGFLTDLSLQEISSTTFRSFEQWRDEKPLLNQVTHL